MRFSWFLSVQEQPSMNLNVRRALESDRQAILDVVIAAFGKVQGQEIADLVTDLLEDQVRNHCYRLLRFLMITLLDTFYLRARKSSISQ